MDTLELFENQIKEDIHVLQTELSYVDDNLAKEEYAFNYWVLSRLFSIDEELIPEMITEYSDKAIDCFVSYEDNKELYIIQNKYYSLDNRVVRANVSDFLVTPIAVLKDGTYKKSEQLKQIFNRAINDADYKMFFYFFSTTRNESIDIQKIVSDFNTTDHKVKCYIEAKYFGLNEIYDLYYGKNYRQDISFKYELGTLNKGTFASLQSEYNIEDLQYEAYYIITPVSELYKMLMAAEEKGYRIFAKNIRDYLGKNPINNGIVETLKSKTERGNFIYYNNGITIICDEIKSAKIDTQTKLRVLPMVNPQIVNGCQTVNSIKKVLDNLSETEIHEEYKGVFVMTKALVINDAEDANSQIFYNDVVKYTNKQNAISDKAFASNMDTFDRLKQEFEKRGFLLYVRPSDKNMFNEKLTKAERANLIEKANTTIKTVGYSVTKPTEIGVPLEKLLQVFLAFLKTGYFAFTKKNKVLAQNDEIFEKYSSQIQNYMTIDNMINIYYLYRRADEDRLNSDDKRTPIAYYVVGFLGDLVGEKTTENIKKKLDYIFGDSKVTEEAYRYLTTLSNTYRMSYEREYGQKGDYNVMIKKPVDEMLLKNVVDVVNMANKWEYINKLP